MRSEGIVLEIRAYRNGNSFWPTFRSSRPRCVCIAAPCLFSRRIVNETRINCENFNPEKKLTTASPIHRNLFRRADKNPGIIYILLTLLLLYTRNNFPSLDNFIKLLFKPFRGVVLVRITVGFNVLVARN